MTFRTELAFRAVTVRERFCQKPDESPVFVERQGAVRTAPLRSRLGRLILLLPLSLSTAVRRAVSQTGFTSLVLFALSIPLTLSAAERLTFTKSFPNSVPAYCSLKITRTGELEYKEAETDENPVRATLPLASTDSLFDLASKLNYFKGGLESGLKVANTGKKTFRYENADGAATEAVFNYSTDPLAAQLLDRFEQIAETERAYVDLDRTVHFDKLGVNDSLSQVESLWLRKELAAPAQFIALLTRVADHSAFMHLARDRAARLKEQFLAQ